MESELKNLCDVLIYNAMTYEDDNKCGKLTLYTKDKKIGIYIDSGWEEFSIFCKMYHSCQDIILKVSEYIKNNFIYKNKVVDLSSHVDFKLNYINVFGSEIKPSFMNCIIKVKTKELDFYKNYYTTCENTIYVTT